jgi:hypothetical protein
MLDKRSYGDPMTLIEDEMRARLREAQEAARQNAELERLRPVYDAACAWADHPLPVTGGADGKLRAAIRQARKNAR